MSSVIELLQYQIEFAVWANRRVMLAATKLTPEELDHDFKTSENSIRKTLVHIYRAERVWVGRMEGSPVAFKVDDDDSMAALTGNWPIVSEQWLAWSRTITEDVAQAELTYRDLRNNTHTQAVWEIILHVVNHSTHHRGQAIGFIRALGHTPPNVDLITFAREGK